MNNRATLGSLTLSLGLCLTVGVGCGGGPSSSEAGAASRGPTAVSVPTPTPAPAPSSLDAPAARAPDAVPFAELVDRLSEPDGEFFSDNVISNETSYLQVSSPLEKTARPGTAYIGVGPEQNFTYIALTKPEIAFIVDIRRQNLVLHLLYKAAFEEATSRAHFVALLLGRPYDAEGDPGANGTLDEVLAHATKRPADAASFAAAQKRLVDRATRDVKLSAADRRGLEVAQRSFFTGQLETRFSLKEANGRLYPTLAELLREKDAGGAQRGFLATEDGFRTVQTLEKQGRVVPLVGDFAGDRAMPGVAAYLKEHKLTVGAFYVSNVEQYLFEPKVWPKWARNVAAMPTDDRSVFIRAYLDQGRKHPLQLRGQRTATVLQRVADFDARQAKKSYVSWWEVANEKY